MASAQDTAGGKSEDDGAIKEIVDLNPGFTAMLKMSSDTYFADNMHMIRAHGTRTRNMQNRGHISIQNNRIISQFRRLSRALEGHPRITTTGHTQVPKA